MTSLTPQIARRAIVALLVRPVRTIGSITLGTLEFVGGVGYLLRDTFLTVRRGLITGRGRRMGWRSLWEQMVRVGVRSVPIVVLVLFCIGAILALQIPRSSGTTARSTAPATSSRWPSSESWGRWWPGSS